MNVNIRSSKISDSNFQKMDKVNINLPSKNRSLTQKYIDQCIDLDENLNQEVNQFYDNNFSSDYIIGVHLRGPMRLHGGSGILRALSETTENVPYEKYFDIIDRKIEDLDQYKIFVCSDAQMVVDKFRRKYGESIITYDAVRTRTGEMNDQSIVREVYDMGWKLKHSSFKNFLSDISWSASRIWDNISIRTIPDHRFGEDILIVAYLLSKTDYMIYGNSNVAYFALNKNAELDGECVYADIIKNMITEDAIPQALQYITYNN